MLKFGLVDPGSSKTNMKILIIILALCSSAKAVPNILPQDFSISNTTWTLPGSVSIATTTNSTALTVYGVITSSTPIPSVSCTAGSPTLSASSTNSQGVITTGAASTSCTVTFATAKAWPKTPVCIAGEGTTLALVRVSAVSGTAFTVTATALNGDVIYYICMGAP